MKRKNDRQKRAKWLFAYSIMVAVGVLLYYFWYYLLRPEDEPNEESTEAEPVAPTPIFYGFSGGGGGSGGSTISSMTFPFVDLLDDTFIHNQGRYVNTDIINQDGEEINLAVTQTMNDVTLQSDLPVSGTLIIS